MQMMTTSELQWLVGQQRPPCLSLYLPTHRRRPETEQDRIRFKNLLAQAVGLLRGSYPDRDVAQFLKPVEALSTSDFWEHQEDGLAVFCSPDTFSYYCLPVSVPEIVVVSGTFHTKPLVGYLNSNRHYFVLSISQKDVQLYQGTPHTLSGVDVQALPKDLRELVSESGARPYLSVRGGAGSSGQSKIHHGHRLGDEGSKKDLMKYFRAIDRALWPILRDERAPLVLAAVSYYHPLFQAATRYPYVLGEGIEGNVERMSSDELREAAWRLVSAYEADVEGELLGQYERAQPAGRASNVLPDIAKGVAQGRVRALLHEAGKTVWGRIDPSTGDVVVHAQQQDVNDADIIDDLCELTILKGGEVFEISTKAPSLQGSPVGAIYRY
jgi:hypothetical protein